MSITKDFEDKKLDAYTEYTQQVYLEDDVSQLLAHTRALEAMLKKHEFAAEDLAYENLCPECHGGWFDGISSQIDYSNRHSENCQLAKLLEGVE